MEMKETWMIILHQAIEIATHVFNRLNLPPGTYTAEDIHRTLTSMYGRYIQNKPCNIFTKGNGDDKYDFRRNFCHTLKSEGIELGVLTPHIFHKIIYFEKCAGIKKKDKYIWVKEPEDTQVCTIEVNFPSKQITQSLPTLLNGICKRNSSCMVFMPTGNKLLGVGNDFIPFKSECVIKGSHALPEVAFKFKLTAMKHIYGLCSVEYYIDKKGRYYLIVTNEKGWKTCLNTRVTENEMKFILKRCNEQESEENGTVSPFLSKKYTNDFDPKAKGPESKHTPKISKTPEDVVNDTMKGGPTISFPARNAPIIYNPKRRVSAQRRQRGHQFLKPRDRRTKKRRRNV